MAPTSDTNDSYRAPQSMPDHYHARMFGRLTPMPKLSYLHRTQPI